MSQQTKFGIQKNPSKEDDLGKNRSCFEAHVRTQTRGECDRPRIHA